MKESITASRDESASTIKMLRAMVGIGIICALLIVITYDGTLPRIERLQAEALEKAIFKVIPGIVKTKTFQLDKNNTFSEAKEKEKSAQLVYAGYDENDQLIGVAIEASGQGYADIIRILYGYDPESQKVIGFYVLESKETPGLGDKIEKDSNFLANFISLDAKLSDDLSKLKNTVIPVKQGAKVNEWEVEGITGATISSRAIGNILDASTNKLLPLIYSNKELFSTKSKEE